MRLPSSKIGKLEYLELRVHKWDADPAAVGLVPGLSLIHIYVCTRDTDGVVGPQTMDEGEAMLATIKAALRIDEGTNEVTAKADWAFAKWEKPAPSAYEPVAKASLKASSKPSCPAWWKTGFEWTDPGLPLFVDLSGMTKGQAYVNGQHLGRYFVATADRKPTGNETSLYVPASWLKAGKHNELALFDEHGAAPAKVKLGYDASQAVISG